MSHPNVALILSPFFVQAFLLLMLEIFYFAYILVERIFYKRIPHPEGRSRAALFLIVNLVPIGLRFGFHFLVK
jgi:hypothetical protein